ncbi:MAG: hypothetical protein KGJ13_08650, partial [Patescibacteria group bacterium]|nr:hypothetical protein [Patescibacteria group bacterium]
KVLQQQQNRTAVLGKDVTFQQNLMANAQKSIAAMAPFVDINSLDEATYNKLLSQSGLTPQEFNTLYSAYQYAATKPNTQVIQDARGGYWVIAQNPITGAVESATNLGLPESFVQLNNGGGLYDPNSNSIVAQGQQTPSNVPPATTTVMPTPAAVSGQGGNAGAAGSGAGSGSGSGAGTTPTTPTAPATPTTTPTAQGSKGPFTNGLESDGTPTWNSLASLPGVSEKQLGLLQQLYASPQLAYDEGIHWILNGGSNSSSGSNSSGGRGATSMAVSDPAQSIGSGILRSYGLNEEDANAISILGKGLSSSLQTAVQNQQGTRQYLGKVATQTQILTAAISSYGGNSGSPLWNIAQQAFQSNVISDPKLQDVKIALQSFLQDYSRITTNSTGSSAAPTDAANATAQDKLNTLMAQGTLESAIGTMIQEMNAVQQSYNGQVSNIESDISNIIQNYAASKNQQSLFGKNLGESGTTTSMANPPGQFGSQAQADAFKKAAGL